MLNRKFVAAVLVFGVLGVIYSGLAQEPSTRSHLRTASVPPPKKPSTLADQLDDLTQKIFGGILPDKGRKPHTQPATTSGTRRTQTSRRPSGTTAANTSPASRAALVALVPRAFIASPRRAW